MPATRRTNGQGANNAAATSNPAAMTTNPPTTHSPYFPTRTELFFLSIYPLTLFLGSAFSHLSPTLYPPFNKSTYSVDAQSFQPAEHAPSYFAQKRNVFNLYFVKIGWFWCSIALLIFTVLSSRGRAARERRKPNDPQETKDAAKLRIESDARMRRRWHTFVRWTLATTCWILVTQWCFGPPIIDRGFLLTGGVCELAAQDLEKPVEELPGGRKTEVASLLTHAACKLAGGAWHGGYDISGHVFILVLGSGMLWLEMLPFLMRDWKGFSTARIVRDYEGRFTHIGTPSTGSGTESSVAGQAGQAPPAVRSALTAAKKELDQHINGVTGPNNVSASTKKTIRAYATVIAMTIAGFSWWMLLMTAAYFHTWFEKLTGLLLASSVLWAVYFLPRGLPYAREVLGMPGV